MQDSWLKKKTEEIQSFVNRKDMKKFHDALKTIYCPNNSGATTLVSTDGSTLLTDKTAILERWTEHFNSVLNRPSSINENAIDRLPQTECNVLLDEFPTIVETRKAVQQLSSGKGPGADAIPAEVYKAGDLHRRAAYSICESWCFCFFLFFFSIHQDVYRDLFVCS